MSLPQSARSPEALQASVGNRTLVAIGGHSRKIGKTSVLEALIGATRDEGWTAVKISANRTGSNGNGTFHLSAEETAGGHCDTARYLEAGARQAFWLKASEPQLPVALPRLFEALNGATNVILESNRLLDHIRPDLYLVVLDFSVEDFKESTRRHFHRADAFIVVERGVAEPPWKELPLRHLQEKPVFRVRPPEYRSIALVRFTADRLHLAEEHRRFNV